MCTRIASFASSSRDISSRVARSNDPKISVISIADMMEKKGWKMERQTTSPPSIHCSVLPHHIGKAAELVRDIADKGIIDEFLVEFFNEIFTPRARAQ